MYKTYKYNKKQYIKRIKIEYMFSILKQYKRIEVRNDKKIITYKNFVLLSLSEIALNIFNKLKKIKMA